jgi:hypothetical protein
MINRFFFKLSVQKKNFFKIFFGIESMKEYIYLYPLLLINALITGKILSFFFVH